MTGYRYEPVKELGNNLIVFDSEFRKLQILENGVAWFRAENEDLDLMTSTEEVNALVEIHKGKLTDFEYCVTVILIEGMIGRTVYNNFRTFKEADELLRDVFKDDRDGVFKIRLGVKFMDGANGMFQESVSGETVYDEVDVFSTEKLFMQEVIYLKEKSRLEYERGAMNEILARMEFLKSFIPPPPPAPPQAPPAYHYPQPEFTETVQDIY